MKTRLTILLALAACLGLTACNDLGSPESALKSVYGDIMTSNLKDLREALEGKALETYGNAGAMAQIKTEIAGLEVKLGAKKYLGGVKHSYRHYTYNYQLEVVARAAKTTGQFSHLKTALITCEWHRGTHFAHPARDPIGMDTDIPDSEECHVTDLN